MTLKNESPRKEGSDVVAGGQAKTTKPKQARFSSADHIANLVEEIRSAGLQLRCTSSDTQLITLPKVLQYLGSRGLSTYEGVALGYLRIATRVKELKDALDIVTVREDVIGPDGLFHKGVGRYILLGKRKDLSPSQTSLDLGGAA